MAVRSDNWRKTLRLDLSNAMPSPICDSRPDQGSLPKNRLILGTPGTDDSTFAFDACQSNEWMLSFTDRSELSELWLFT
jgi:hypothetical protein